MGVVADDEPATSSSSTTARATSARPSARSSARAPTSTVTADRDAALECDGLVVPGVGAFAACMAGIRAVRGDEIVGRRLAGGRPVLGICVGMQVLFERGVEHGVETEGLGEWPGTVERPARAGRSRTWAGTPSTCPRARALFAGVEDERFYFVHSYGVRRWELEVDPAGARAPPLVTWASTASRSSPRSRTVRCGPPSSTPRSPATPVRACCATGSRPSEPVTR